MLCSPTPRAGRRRRGGLYRPPAPPERPGGVTYNRRVLGADSPALAAGRVDMASLVDRSAPASTADLTESEVQNRQAVLDMVRYFNSHNTRGMLSCFNDDMEWLDVPMETPYRGKAEIRAFLDTLFDAF